MANIWQTEKLLENLNFDRVIAWTWFLSKVSKTPEVEVLKEILSYELSKNETVLEYNQICQMFLQRDENEAFLNFTFLAEFPKNIQRFRDIAFYR